MTSVVLDIIEKDGKNTDEKFRQMISARLNNMEDPCTWNILYEALIDPIVNETKVAGKIKPSTVDGKSTAPLIIAGSVNFNDFFAVSSATCISKERVADIVTGIVVVYLILKQVIINAMLFFSMHRRSMYRFSWYYCSL